MNSSGIRLPEPLQPACRSWRLGGLQLSLGWHDRGGPPQRGALLLVPLGHSLSLRQGNLERLLRPPLDLLYLPAAAQGVQTSSFQGWCVQLDDGRLVRLAGELCQQRLTPARLRRRLQACRALQPRHTPLRELLAGLGQMLQVCEETSQVTQDQLALVGFDQLIERLLVLLLCGDLVREAHRDDGGAPSGKARIVEELLGWIQANLHRPLQLRDLVAQSGYSQRSLRNIFQQRFGCSPVQWMRSQRLAAARARLQDPAPTDTVSSVAAACGYRHLSQFSRDFQLAHGLRPSELLREARRGWTAAERDGGAAP